MSVPSTIAEHWDVVFGLLVLSCAMIAGLVKIINALLSRMTNLVIQPIQESQKMITENLAKVTSRLETLEKDYCHLRGEHDAMHRNGGGVHA